MNHSVLPPFSPKLILYRDDLILVANKFAGIPIHETKDPNRPNFTRYLKDSLRLPYLRTANRLDLYTTGIVVFGLDPQRNNEVDEILKKSRKFYLALVHGILELDQFRVESFLKDGNKKVMTVRSGGKKAITKFRVIQRDRKNDRTLLEAELVTGRRHQIRIHLAESGHPIVGDKVYGNSTNSGSDEILYLHSYKLDLSSYKKNLVLVCEPDWKIFGNQVKTSLPPPEVPGRKDFLSGNPSTPQLWKDSFHD